MNNAGGGSWGLTASLNNLVVAVLGFEHSASPASYFRNIVELVALTRAEYPVVLPQGRLVLANSEVFHEVDKFFYSGQFESVIK